MKHKIEKLGIVSTASVFKCTGRHWDEWVHLLNKHGAKNLDHKEIVSLLKKKYKLTPWWQQGVTTGYEMALGKKIEGHSESGGFSTVATRTLSASKKQVWNFLTTPEALEVWLKPLSDFNFVKGHDYETLDGYFGRVRTLKIEERVRMSFQETEWDKPSILQIYLIARPKQKSVLIFQHGHLANGRLRLKFRDHWKQVLIDLQDKIKVST
jgi:uncharacterized protein YndB with AHSA1/START domain